MQGRAGQSTPREREKRVKIFFFYFGWTPLLQLGPVLYIVDK
jgi:hypothetical protein